MGDGRAHSGHNVLPPPMPYSSSEQSATCPSPASVDVRSIMDVPVLHCPPATCAPESLMATRDTQLAALESWTACAAIACAAASSSGYADSELQEAP